MKKYINSINCKFFINMIWPLACVLIIPTIVWIISNTYAMKTNEEKVALLVSEKIERSVAVADATLTQAENLVVQISGNSAFDNFYSKKNLQYREKMKLQQTLSSFYLENSSIQNVYMYSAVSKILIDKNGVDYNAYDFYRYKCGFDEKTSRKWSANTEKISHLNGYQLKTVNINENGEEKQILPYLRIVPIEYPSKKYGLIGILIDTKDMLKNFDELADVYVYDSKGELIMSRGKKLNKSIFEENSRTNRSSVRINGENLYKFTYTSPKNQWQYNVLMHEDDALKDVVVVNIILSTLNFITFLIDLLLCVWLTYGKIRSYRNIMDMLGEKNDTPLFSGIKHNEFEILKPYIGNVLDENGKMKKKIENLSETDGQKVIRLLLLSKNTSEENARKLCKDYNMEFSGDKFVVMVLQSSVPYHINEINNKGVFLNQLIKKYISEDFYLYVADSKTIVAVLNFDMDIAEFYMQLREGLARMNMDVFYRYRTDVCIGIGEGVNNLSEISDSYEEALAVLDYCRLVGSKTILFYSELPSEKTMYYYSMEIEQRLIQEMSTGKTEEALKTANEIYRENFVERVLPRSRIKELLSEITSTLNKYRQVYFKDEEDIDFSELNFTVKSFFEYLNEFILLACENADAVEYSLQSLRFGKIIEYIDENYGDANISLTSIAKKFGFKDITHISKSIKKYTGDNFSSYLEKIRIEKACEMLKNNVPVKEIADKVGYLSSVSLRRAFKRRMGISPSEYSKTILKTN